MGGLDVNFLGGFAASRRLRIIRATRADALADDLASQLTSADGPTPIDECFVAVSEVGLGGWLRQFMIERLGAWGGMEMPSLREFLLTLAERVSPTPELGCRIDPLRELTYILAERVIRAESLSDPLHFQLKPLLDMCSGLDGLDREVLFVHCHAITATFNRYELDRPDLIEAWMSSDRAWQEVGDAWTVQAQSVECWQRALWRDVVADKWLSHRQWNAVRALISALNQGECPIQIREVGFVGIFALSSIPQLAMNLLVALGRHVRVHLYLLTPSLKARGVSSG